MDDIFLPGVDGYIVADVLLPKEPPRGLLVGVAHGHVAAHTFVNVGKYGFLADNTNNFRPLQQNE
jgi:hypothetical protein